VSNQREKYYWCSTAKFFDPFETTWASGHPKSGQDNCAFFELNQATGKQELKTALCTEEKQFICDVSS